MKDLIEAIKLINDEKLVNVFRWVSINITKGDFICSFTDIMKYAISDANLFNKIINGLSKIPYSNRIGEIYSDFIKSNNYIPFHPLLYGNYLSLDIKQSDGSYK